jgi:hypothetical protein
VSVDEFQELIPKDLIDAAYALPAEMGDFVWRANDVKKVLACLIEKKRKIAGGEIWRMDEGEITLTWDVWDYGLDNISQSENPEKWYKKAIENISLFDQPGEVKYLYSVVLY